MEGAASTAAAAAGTETKTAGKIVSSGKPEIATLPVNGQENSTDDNNQTGAGGASGAAETPEEKATREAAELAERNKLPEVNDEQLVALLESKGIKLDDKGFDGLKEKLKPAAATKPEPTAEEKLAAEKAFEKRMLDHFIEKGGTVENFAALKQMAEMDLTELSNSEIRREMKALDFSEDEIAVIIKERYYQINPEELKQGEEESTEDFEKRKSFTEKKIAAFSKRPEKKGEHLKKSAVDALAQLRQTIEIEDSLKEAEVKHSQRVDELTATLPKKMLIELGEVDGRKLPAIEIDVTDEIISEVAATLKDIKDPAKSKQFLYNEDNSFNLQNLANVMIRNKALEAALQKSFLQGDTEGETRATTEFEKTFPGRKASDIGVGGQNGGGNTQKRKGVIASAGQPEPADLQHK